MKHRLFLLTVVLTQALLVGPVTAEERVAFLVGVDPQYLAEKSDSPTRLDPFSEQAAVRLVQVLKKFPGREIPQNLGEGRDVLDPDDLAAEKSDRRNPSKGEGLRHGFLYVELIDAEGITNDRFVVRSYTTRDNWATHGWDRMWTKPVSIPDMN